MLQPLSCLDQWGGEAGWQARAFLGSSRLSLTQRGKLRPREGRDSLQALSGLTSGLGLGGKLAGASQDGGGSAEKALACIRDTGVAGCREKPGASGPWGPYTTGGNFLVWDREELGGGWPAGHSAGEASCSAAQPPCRTWLPCKSPHCRVPALHKGGRQGVGSDLGQRVGRAGYKPATGSESHHSEK